MSKILGVDLGTHSIGLTVRDEGLSRSLEEQLIFYSSVIFPAGVGSDNTGEYSYAAERTKHRSSRRLYMARKYRKWNTLEVLIEHGYCPLKMDDLKKWSTYDKEKGYTRKYPVESLDFEQWIRLDFNGDGISDYSSPYQLRDELATTQFDFSIQINRYKLGRALYHIAQRRGFKSSKGDTIKGQEKINGETVKSTENMFANTNVISVSFETPENIKNTSYMFSYLNSDTLLLEFLDTSHVENMQGMFEGVNLYELDSVGVFSNLVQSIQLLPDSTGSGSLAADIHFSQDGKNLYASVRGIDRIYTLSVNADGAKVVESLEDEISWPRNFVQDPTGNFLLVANQNGDNIIVYKRNMQSGKLTLLENKVEISQPVCLKF